MLELLLVQCSLQQTDSSGSQAFCVPSKASAGLAWGQAWECGTAGVWKWGDGSWGGEEEGCVVSGKGPKFPGSQMLVCGAWGRSCYAELGRRKKNKQWGF